MGKAFQTPESYLLSDSSDTLSQDSFLMDETSLLRRFLLYLSDMHMGSLYWCIGFLMVFCTIDILWFCWDFIIQ